MKTNYTALTGNSMFADDLYQQAIDVLRTNIIISEQTARAVLEKVTQDKDAQKVFAMIVRFLPNVLNHHLSLFTRGEKLHRPTDEGNFAHYLNAYPHGCVVVEESERSDDCRQFTLNFLDFYRDVLFPAVADKLEILLFGLQALHQQISLDNFYDTFKILQALPEEGMAQILDFSWHCKGHRISQIVDKVNFTSIYTPRCNHIPSDVQLALANQTNFPDVLVNANRALERDLMVNKTNRITILQQTISDSMKLIPRIAEILVEKAVLVKLTPLPVTSTSSVKIALHYGMFPTANEREIDWARFMLQENFSWRVADLFFSDEFADTLMNKLPTLTCVDQTNCFGIIRQDHNIEEYKKLLVAHTHNLTLPEPSFYTTQHWSDSLPALPSFPPLPNMNSLPSVRELTWLGVLGVSVALGACTFIYRTVCGHSSFWKKPRPATANTNQPSRQPALTNQSNYKYSRI